MKELYTAIIIDDEAKARRILEALLLDSCPNVKVLDSAEDVLSGIKVINKHKPDIVFLDIEMPGYTGFQLLDFFDDIEFSVIFTTAYSEYAIQAFQVSAVDYLLKPIQIDQLKNSIEKVSRIKGNGNREKLNTLKENYTEQSIQKIALSTSQGLNFIELKNIVYLEADGAYTNIFLLNGSKLMISKKIKDFEVLLKPENNFFRTHRSFIANLAKIKNYVKQDGGRHIIMENGATIHLARDRKDEFEHLISGLKI